MEPFDIAVEIERFMRGTTLDADDTIETLLEALYKTLEEEFQ